MENKKKITDRHFMVSLHRTATGTSLALIYHAVSESHAVILAEKEFTGWKIEASVIVP